MDDLILVTTLEESGTTTRCLINSGRSLIAQFFDKVGKKILFYSFLS
jgi:hypothetical protein